MNQNSIKFFTTKDNYNNIILKNFEPQLLFDSSKKKYLLKCLYCNYITDKTFNFEKHKVACFNKNTNAHSKHISLFKIHKITEENDTSIKKTNPLLSQI